MSKNVKGVAPGFLLMPAREYEWELVRRVQIDIPNTGSITSLLNEFQSQEGLKFPGEDEFVLYEDNLLLLWQAVQVLFAAKKYPDLKDDECLNVVAIETAGETLVLHAEVIRNI